jgi:hypothetical protein
MRSLESLLGGGKCNVRRRPIVGSVEALTDAGAGFHLVDELGSDGFQAFAEDVVGYADFGQVLAG